MILKSSSERQTKNIAKKIAGEIKDKGGVVGLIGDLGAGKTTFAQGFAEGLGVKEKVISPTFVLIREHKIPNTKKMFFHIDLYRLEGEVNLLELGLRDLFKGDDVVLIEWADKVKGRLPGNAVEVVIKKIDFKTREITVT